MGAGPQVGRNQSAIRHKREFNSDETMFVVCVPSSTPSTGRSKKSYHTFIADATNAYFHVDQDEDCDVDPLAEWLEQQAAMENLTSVL